MRGLTRTRCGRTFERSVAAGSRRAGMLCGPERSRIATVISGRFLVFPPPQGSGGECSSDLEASFLGSLLGELQLLLGQRDARVSAAGLLHELYGEAPPSAPDLENVMAAVHSSLIFFFFLAHQRY